MSEHIVLVPKVSGNELLRTMAKFGQDTLGVRIVSALELAKIALMRSGICIPETFLTREEEVAVIDSFLISIPYFQAASYADAQQLAVALYTLKNYVESDKLDFVENALSNGEFPEKNKAIFEVYSKYMTFCQENGRIDTEGVIRKAIAQSSPFDARYITLQEYPITPLEQALINSLSNGKVQNIRIMDLLEVEAKSGPSRCYTEAYGAVNEVEAILSEIYQKNIPLDQCVVAMANPIAYSQIFFDLNQRYDVPTTYGCGIPITNTNPAALLKLLLKWDTTGYHGIDALREILLSDAFNRKTFQQVLGLEQKMKIREIERLSKMAGSLRISYDAVTNKRRIHDYKRVLDQQLDEAKASGSETMVADAQDACTYLEWTRILAQELECGLVAFFQKFVYLRSGNVRKFDKAALETICDCLIAYQRYVPDGQLHDIIPDVLQQTVCSEISKEGHLHLTSITGAISAMRNNLYVCGLSSAEFPGNPTENYLLLDNDLLRFIDKEYAPTSFNTVQKRIGELENLLSFATDLGIGTKLSYSNYDLAQLKARNPSSVLFSVFEKENSSPTMDDFFKNLNHADYFCNEISNTRLIGRAYREGAAISYKLKEEQRKYDAAELLDRAWSPSALDVFTACPRHFYLSRILGIPENEPDDPFMVISAADLGTLAHSMMEHLAECTMTEKQFLEMSEKAFDDFLCSRPPMHANVAEEAKWDFIKMMKYAYDQNPDNQVLSAEEEYEFVHPCGIKLRGFPDRVERLADGNCLVVDFKTKFKLDHKQDDIDSCLQVVIYAWLCEQAGIPISSSVYRYLRLQEEVSCRFDGDMKDQLEEKLANFKHAIENNDFPRTPGKNGKNCKYCTMKSICEWMEDHKEGECSHD